MYLRDIEPNPKSSRKKGNIKASLKKVLTHLPALKIDDLSSNDSFINYF